MVLQRKSEVFYQVSVIFVPGTVCVWLEPDSSVGDARCIGVWSRTVRKLVLGAKRICRSTAAYLTLWCPVVTWMLIEKVGRENES